MGVDSLLTPKKLDGVTNVEIIIIFPALNFETEFKNIVWWWQNIGCKYFDMAAWKRRLSAKRHRSKKQEGMLLQILAIFIWIVQCQKDVVKTEEIW